MEGPCRVASARASRCTPAPARVTSQTTTDGMNANSIGGWDRRGRRPLAIPDVLDTDVTMSMIPKSRRVRHDARHMAKKGFRLSALGFRKSLQIAVARL